MIYLSLSGKKARAALKVLGKSRLCKSNRKKLLFERQRYAPFWTEFYKYQEERYVRKANPYSRYTRNPYTISRVVCISEK